MFNYFCNHKNHTYGLTKKAEIKCIFARILALGFNLLTFKDSYPINLICNLNHCEMMFIFPVWPFIHIHVLSFIDLASGLFELLQDQDFFGRANRRKPIVPFGNNGKGRKSKT